MQRREKKMMMIYDYEHHKYINNSKKKLVLEKKVVWFTDGICAAGPKSKKKITGYNNGHLSHLLISLIKIAN